MSLKLHKMMSRLNEHSDPIMDNQTYNDLIHGRITVADNLPDMSFEDVPIKLEKSSWEYIQDSGGEFLVRDFDFLNFQTMFYFVAEGLKLQEKNQHHCTMIINALSVAIRMQTHDVNEVTELDLELSEQLDDIYQDTQYFHSVGGRREG